MDGLAKISWRARCGAVALALVVIAGVIVGVAQLGDGRTTQSNVQAEVKLPAGTKVTAIAAGCHHSLALTSTGQVLAWGNDAYGELGDGETTQSDVPVKVKLPAGTKVTAISGGAHHSLTLTSAGQVLAWGENGGQLGDGNTTQSDVPVKVRLR